MKCFIALGSNLGNPLQQILYAAEALKKLPETLFLRLSPCYQSPALTLAPQTKDQNAEVPAKGASLYAMGDSQGGESRFSPLSASISFAERSIKTIKRFPGGIADKNVYPDYINSVAMLETKLSPLQLLKELQNIEQQQGRVRLERWGNRTIDLDILLYGDLVIAMPELTIPHVELKKRAFVLYPLSDLAPHWILPDGENVQSLKEKCPSNGIQRIGEQGS